MSYHELIEDRAIKILLDTEDNDYQGNSFLLVQRVPPTRDLGFLSYGWGSCSGCDALEAAYGDPQALAELGDELVAGTRWFDGAEALYAWMQDEESHDLQWWGHSDAFKRWLREVTEWLNQNAVTPEQVQTAIESIRSDQ